MKSLPELLQRRRVLVLLGAGGVGKTTSAIAVAFAAAKLGRRVALLSIDPAKRLAAALGLALGSELRPVTLPKELEATGTVDAAMLDQKAVFDAMVRRHAPTAGVAERILAHPVYRSISTNLIGPLEYMALAKLQELSDDARYDLIVLDTPPDTHALDFLERPNVLAGFMDNRVMQWLVKPFALAGKLGLGRLFNAGERLMGGIARVTGVGALHKFADFLILMQDVIEGFHRSGEKVVTLLKDEGTSFLLVTVPTQAAVRGAGNIASELHRLGYGLDLAIVNRCLPPEAVEVARDVAAGDGLPTTEREAVRRRLVLEEASRARLAERLAALHAGRQGAAAVPRLFLHELEVDERPDGGVGGLVTIAGLLAGAAWS